MIRPGDIFTGDETGEDYEVLEFLGKGGMGVVHKIRRFSDGTDFVAKAPLDASGLKIKKIENESRILKKLEELGVQNVVRAVELGSFSTSHQKIPILVMHVAKGDEISTVIKRNVSPEDVRDIMLTISKTMDEVHKAGYIHRDLKPDNIFLDDVGGSNTVTVIDFGIAAVKEDHETFARTVSVAHTRFYAPPEQARGTVSIGNDIFSLGATGYAMLVGVDQLKRDVDNHISPPYNPFHHFHNRTIEDEHLFKVIEKATQPERRNRFATMYDMAAMLEGRPPDDTFPRIIADGHAHPLYPDIDTWSLGRNHPPFSEADILINETSPGATFISRNQVIIRRSGDCSFKLFHQKVKNDTRVAVSQEDGSLRWNKVGDNGWPLGPHHQMICFGYADTPPGKLNREGQPLQPGPYKVIEYFPPNPDSESITGESN